MERHRTERRARSTGVEKQLGGAQRIEQQVGGAQWEATSTQCDFGSSSEAAGASVAHTHIGARHQTCLQKDANKVYAARSHIESICTQVPSTHCEAHP